MAMNNLMAMAFFSCGFSANSICSTQIYYFDFETKAKQSECIHNQNWHPFDYVTIRNEEVQGAHITKTMHGADCWMNPCLLIPKMNI